MKRYLLAGLLLIGLLPGCVRRPQSRLLIGVRTANDHVPFYLAESLGYYRTAGLPVDVRVFASNNEIVEATRRGDLQMGAIPAPSAIAAIANGAPIVIVAMTGRGSDGLLVRSDGPSGDAASLRGKRIGSVRGSILDILLRESLEADGLDPERDVTLIYFSQLGDMIAALRTKQIDAASNTEPYLTQAEQDGWGRILYYYTRDWPDHPCCVVFARRDLIQRNAALVEQVLKVHVQAVDYANAHPREAAQAIADVLEGTSPALIEQSLAPSKMRLDYHLETGEIQRLAEEMQRMGLIERVPPQAELVDTHFLPE